VINYIVIIEKSPRLSYTIGKYYIITYMNFDFFELKNDIGFYDRFSYGGDNFSYYNWFYTEKELRREKINVFKKKKKKK
jgi:hypothetical protein